MVSALARRDAVTARFAGSGARDTGLTREGLYKSLSRTGNPSFATILKVANALGLRVAFVPSPAQPRKATTARQAKPAPVKRARVAAQKTPAAPAKNARRG